MQKRRDFFVYFLVFLFLSFLIYFLAKTSLFKPISSATVKILAPFSAVSYNLFSNAQNAIYSSKIKSLQDQNLSLSKKLVDQNKLIADNRALRDQFAVSFPRPQSLVVADVVGAPSFVPGFSIPETLVLDRGSSDGVKVGDAVVYKDSLLGKVVKTSSFISSVMLINNSSSSFTAKTLSTNAQGVVVGEGGGNMILSEVLLSDSLKKDDLVLTKGSINEKGEGLPADLVVGKIISVSKNASDLFQKAEVKSEFDLTKIDRVFILINP